MAVFDELWDVESGNRLERVTSELEGLHAVAEILEVNGPGFLDALMLGAFEHDQRDRTVRELPVLEGDELRARLRDMAPPADLATDDVAGGGSSERVEGGIAPVDVVEHADGGGSGGNAGQLTTSRDPATPLPD